MADNLNIKERYTNEISEIEYILKNLENGHVREIQGTGYPYLSTEAQKLRKDIFKLLYKIEKGKPSDIEEMG